MNKMDKGKDNDLVVVHICNNFPPPHTPEKYHMHVHVHMSYVYTCICMYSQTLGETDNICGG